MLKIGKTYIMEENGAARLCADLVIEDRCATFWFSVRSEQADWLTLGRSDAFVMALLPYAMRRGLEIAFESPMSERLYYQLVSSLIPALSFAGERYHFIRLTGPLTTEQIPNQGAVGTGFSGGADSLYTIMRHGTGSELPLTHIAVFNTGCFEDRRGLYGLYRQAEAFGAEQNLKAIFVDTNFNEILPEYYESVYTFRNLACALALQGVFAVYLVSSGPDAANMELNLMICDRYDLLTVNCAATESIVFYLSGAETTRVGKMTALTEWEPSYRWLHPCIGTVGKNYNCGHCKKCIQDMTILYTLGKLEQYQGVYNVKEYLRHLPERFGFVLARDLDSSSGKQTRELLEERHIPVPPAAYIYARYFKRAMQNLKVSQREGDQNHG